MSCDLMGNQSASTSGVEDKPKRTIMSHRTVSRCSILTSLVMIGIFAHLIQAYQYPIQQQLSSARQRGERADVISQTYHQFDNQNQPVQEKQQSAAEVQIDRGNEEAPNDKSDYDTEAQQLRQLHQVVDSVAQLLNEEEQELSQSGRRQRALPNSNDKQQQVDTTKPVSINHELMSESEIRQALEELEKVQQLERQEAVLHSIDTRFRPTNTESSPVSPTPSTQTAADKQPTLESLIEELGDDLIDDQIMAASQEAERMLQQRESPRLTDKGNSVSPIASKPKSDGSQVATSTPASQQQANKSSQTQSSLIVGQLDSLASELNSALTNDFYSFHEQNGAQSAQAPSESSSAVNQDDSYQPKNTNSLRHQQDLEPAAQTRNSVTQQDPQGPNTFREQDRTIRFDFSQPSSLPNQLRPQAQSNQDALIRAFRQQTGANPDDGNQLPSSTLLPNVDGFWRATNPVGSPLSEDVGDIGQQYNRAQSLPPLPASKFQSLSPSNQFPQQAPQSRQAQHIHFTGHSFIPSSGQQQFPDPQQANINNNRGFPPTSTPLISVLSGSDTSSGNSVSWNPPAPIGVAHQQQQQPNAGPVFNQPFPSPALPSLRPGNNIETNMNQPFLDSAERGPPSPLFRGAFSNAQSNIQNPRLPQSDAKFVSSTEMSNLPETSTPEDRFQPATTTQWTPSASSSSPNIERDILDSQPRSTVRSLPNNQRFFSPNDLVGPTSTLSSINTDQLRASRFNNQQGLPTITTTTTTPVSIQPTNTTKKDDMLIYYYYYYDDNKNATVVAKNISSSAASSIPLDTAIEADGGVEDTPYMDDPAPISNLRSNSFKPSTSTAPTPTTSTSTASSSLPFEHTTLNGARSQPNNLGHSRQLTSSEPSASHSRQPGIESPSSDGSRSQSAPVTRGFSPLPRQPSAESSSAFIPTSTSVPSSSSLRPVGRGSLNNEANNRIAGSEPPVPRTPAMSQAQLNRVEAPHSAHPHHGQAASSSNRLQHDLINNVLQGIPSAQPARQPSSVSTVTPPNNTNRGPLSNASRYGTNNNVALDPFGLDTTGPANLAHLAISPSTDASANPSHKNWSSSPNSNTVNKKQNNSVNPHSTNGLTRTTPDNNRQTGQHHFSSQRNSSVNQSRASSNTGSTSTQSSRVSANNNSNQSGVQTSAARQFFPESSSELPVDREATDVPSRSSIQSSRQEPHNSVSRVSTPTSIQEPIQRLSTQIPRQEAQSNLSSQRIAQATRQSSSNINPISSGLMNSDEPQLSRENIQRVQASGPGNGRPSTPDGNTSNGFTKSPLQVSTLSPPVQSSVVQRFQSTDKLAASTVPSTQPSVSTSISRSFVTPQQVQVTTSVNPSSVSSASASSVGNQISSTASSYPLTPTSVSVSSTVSEQSSSEANITSSPQTMTSAQTESSDSLNASTRKRFGNRNNRFQTRLNSIGGSAVTRSTTSTTPAPTPSTTTSTRRPFISTTRKSSKQLFAGRRRLGSTQSESNIAPTSPASLVVGGSSNSVSVSESSSPATAGSPSARTRFGNTFNPRSRSTTTGPSSGIEQNVSTQKPVLFAQRSTNKPRLPFMKPQNNRADSSAAEVGTSIQPEVPMNSSTSGEALTGIVNIDKLPVSTTGNSEASSAEPVEEAVTGATEDESNDKKETASSSSVGNGGVSESIPPLSVSPASTTAPEATGSRNKPKVRPLFASRQRSSALFGNRRNNSTQTN